jgi:hypothetical protein
MVLDLEHDNGQLKTDCTLDRRQQPRIYEQFPVKVEGVDASGAGFDDAVRLDNVSAGGLYLRLARPIERGAQLAMAIRFSNVELLASSAPRLAVRGVVLRVDPQPGGTFGLAVAFTHHRFL